MTRLRLVRLLLVRPLLVASLLAILAGCAPTRTAVDSTLPGVGTLPPPASAWPSAQYDARHSSGTTATGPQRGDIRWQATLGGAIVPGPVIGIHGDILAASNDGVLTDLDPHDGSVLWRFDGGNGYGSDLSTSPAVLTDGRILWPGPGDTLFVLTAGGAELERIAFDGTVLSPAVAGHGRVYVADASGGLAALDASGSRISRVWRMRLGTSSYASPTVGPDGSIYAADDRHLYAVRDLGSHGAVRWSFETKKPIEVSSAVSPDGTVILGTNHDKEYGIDRDGTVKWAIDIGDYTYSSSTATAAGLAYFADNTGRVRTVTSSSGAVLHVQRPLGPTGKEHAWTSIAVDAAGDTYWGTEKGNVYGYDAAGTRLFGVDVGSGVTSYPALGADGTLYFGTHDGRLIALGGGG